MIPQQQEQRIDVPNALPVPNNLNIAEVQLILEFLGSGPFNRVGPLVTRLQAQAQQAVLEYANPPAPGAPLPVISGVEQAQVPAGLPSSWYASTLDQAREALVEAERKRRSKSGTLDVTPRSDERPDEDYAIATILIGQGQSHLDEALPNGQLERVRPAFTVLQYGVRLLGEYFARRVHE